MLHFRPSALTPPVHCIKYWNVASSVMEQSKQHASIENETRIINQAMAMPA
jgi:hypothetical protein